MFSIPTEVSLCVESGIRIVYSMGIPGIKAKEAGRHVDLFMRRFFFKLDELIDKENNEY